MLPGHDHRRVPRVTVGADWAVGIVEVAKGRAAAGRFATWDAIVLDACETGFAYGGEFAAITHGPTGSRIVRLACETKAILTAVAAHAQGALGREWVADRNARVDGRPEEDDLECV